MRIAGLLLVIVGALALAYGGFTYTRKSTKDLGLFSVQYKERERVQVPIWLGLTAVGAGAGLLYFGRKR